MDMRMHQLILAAVLLIAASGAATPIDTGWDLLYAVESRNGGDFLDLLTESLRTQIESRFQQLKELAESEPSFVDDALSSAGVNVTAFDLGWMSAPDFVSRILDGVVLPNLNDIVEEEASLSGRNADVTFEWNSGYVLTVQMVWESSAWRVVGSPVLGEMFR